MTNEAVLTNCGSFTSTSTSSMHLQHPRTAFIYCRQSTSTSNPLHSRAQRALVAGVDGSLPLPSLRSHHLPPPPPLLLLPSPLLPRSPPRLTLPPSPVTMEGGGGNIKVVVRVRPFNSRGISLLPSLFLAISF
ncbi:hypothetical protein TRV_01972 [Trichophyton verrucosum HKI 0517]|uniref:Kinesin motor domain-containing protein n=1 Tax=Trichophyton verrucosum (strain HKI 0517) TaxID=663202 RepID=D4D4F6_TRIVH|nr:uncharacterized protein TRV_01972 [Trichophyton verrucosum HKI 0517]EFE43303.1 hypothetical protein TRV_01972 [Trichophyton verrucosum HKI 0517]